MKHKYLKDVATLELDWAKCTGCGMCIQVCPHSVFEIADKKSRIADKNACMECGACAKNCPFFAISVTPGVGCAAKIISNFLTGEDSDCGCSGGSSSGGCC